MRLFLVRHAEAAPGDPDDLRPLTPAGRDAARALGGRLAEHHPDAVVASPLLRALETADLIAHACGLAAEPDDRLGPGATPGTLRAAVEGHGDTVVVVGHQPDCGDIVLALTGREVGFPPAGVQELEL
ncbi:MAG TPA: histidine phosphatase family protein [Gaiellaceae bacterium]|nr:histidine phosphatase family protein [Gaiellaceae bacterium]